VDLIRDCRNGRGSGASRGGLDRRSCPGPVGGCHRSVFQSMGKDPHARAVPAEISATTQTKLHYYRPESTSGKYICTALALLSV